MTRSTHQYRMKIYGASSRRPLRKPCGYRWGEATCYSVHTQLHVRSTLTLPDWRIQHLGVTKRKRWWKALNINLESENFLITGRLFVSLIMGSSCLHVTAHRTQIRHLSPPKTSLPPPSYPTPGHAALMRDHPKSVNMAPISPLVVLCTHEYRPWRGGFLRLSKNCPITNAATASTGGKFKSEPMQIGPSWLHVSECIMQMSEE